MTELPLRAASSLSDSLLAIREGTRPSHVALQYAELRALKYGELARSIDRLGTLFARWQLKPGDRLAIATHDDAAVLAGVLACWSFGISAVIISPGATRDEATAMLAQAAPAACLLDRALAAHWPVGQAHVLAVAPPAERSSTIGRLLRHVRKSAPAAETYPEVLDALEPTTPPAALPDSLEAYVLFTSGSTSRPKGVRIGRAAILAHAKTLARQWGYGPDSRIHDVLPLHHVDGLVQGPLIAYLCGATCFRPARFSVDTVGQVFDSLHRDAITHLVSVPAMLAILLRYSEKEPTLGGPELRFVISAGGYLEEDLWRRFEERFSVRVANMYGLTETVTGGCFSGPDDASHRIGTVGKAVDCEVSLAGGELLMRGPSLMMGYLDAAQETETMLAGAWLHTGDLAEIDAEGFVKIVGRLKNLVISGGLNIQPEEIAELLGGLDGVLEAAAFGVPDPTFGEILVACVVPVEGHSIDEAELVKSCRTRLSEHKVPKRIAVISALPRGPAGKVIISAARELFRQRIEESRPAAVKDAPERVRAIAARVFRIPADQLKEDDGPGKTPGWDSFAHLELVAGLEQAFSIKLTVGEIQGIRTLRSARELIERRLEAPL